MRAAGQVERQRVGDGEVVRREPGGRERMRDVAHLVAVAEPDDGGKVVLDDAEVVAVVAMSVGSSSVSRRPTMRCLLRLGACQ